MLWDNNKSHKKQGFTLSLEETFFEKPQGVGVNLNPPFFNRTPPNDCFWPCNGSIVESFFLFLIIDFAYIFYIFVACKQQSRMRKHIKSIESKNNFNLLFPNLIIVTFIALIIIPNLLIGAVTCGLIPFNEILYYLFYKTGYLLDPLIYIFNSRLKRIICYKVKPVASWWKG